MQEATLTLHGFCGMSDPIVTRDVRGQMRRDGGLTMDPNATLRRLDEAIDEREMDEAGFLVKELARWIASGGFEPEWWRYPRATAFYSARVPGRAISSL